MARYDGDTGSGIRKEKDKRSDVGVYIDQRSLQDTLVVVWCCNIILIRDLNIYLSGVLPSAEYRQCLLVFL